MSQFGLRVKLYNVICEQHMPTRDFEYITRGDEERFSSQTVNAKDICEALAKTTCIGYASIVVVINTICISRPKILRKVLKAIKINSHLRHKSKLIMTMYKYDSALLQQNMEDEFGKYLQNMKITYPNSYLAHSVKPDYSTHSDNSRGSDQEEEEVRSENSNSAANHIKVIKGSDQEEEDVEEKVRSENSNSAANHIKVIKKNNLSLLTDAYYFNQMKLHNAIFKQTLVDSDMTMFQIVLFIVYWIANVSLQPMQTMLMQSDLSELFSYLLHSSTNADLYFFNINPAFTIIINNYYFNNTLQTRQGSEQDVKRLLRELKVAGISHLVCQDCDRNKMLQLMNCLKHLDCSSLKSLFIVIMSHGDANDVIHTPDGGDIVIKTDIVEPLQSNSSLKDVNIAIAVLACRGHIDPPYATRGEIKSIQPTDPRHLANNLAIIYSNPNNVQNIRCPKHGCPFMISLCKHIRKYSELRKIVQQIDEDLLEEPYYECFKKIPELVTSDPQRQHHIHRHPGQASKMLKFLESLDLALSNSELFTRIGQPLFSMGVSLSSSPGSGISFDDLYLDPALDADQCSLDNDSALERCRTECVDNTSE